MKTIRVVQIIDVLYYGGAQTMQVMFARAAQQIPNIELTVISLRDNTYNTPIPGQLRDLGVKVEFFSASKLWNIKRFIELVTYLRREKFDIVHTHLPYANILGVLAGWFAGIPAIASLRNSKDDNWGRYSFIRTVLETIILRYMAKRVMAVGYSTAQAHQKRLGHQKIIAIPNALELIPTTTEEERKNIRMELVGDLETEVIISVGRLVPQKGYNDLLLAFSSVVKKYPRSRLLIAGDGPLLDALSKLKNELGIAEKVLFLGSRNDVPRLLAASDLYVNSSHWEGLSVAILEAMAAGLPVVATNVSDTPQVVSEVAGRVVPSQSPEALEHAINFFLQDPDIRKKFGEQARECIRLNHSPDAWAKSIVDMYQIVLKSPKPI